MRRPDAQAGQSTCARRKDTNLKLLDCLSSLQNGQSIQLQPELRLAPVHEVSYTAPNRILRSPPHLQSNFRRVEHYPLVLVSASWRTPPATLTTAAPKLDGGRLCLNLARTTPL